MSNAQPDVVITKQITYALQDITAVDRGIVIHGVNCQGKMGSGVALAIRNKWPAVYDSYLQFCKTAPDPEALLGTSQFLMVAEELYVGNLFTQLNYGSDGKRYANYQCVKKTLEDTMIFARHTGLPVYMPKIGCLRGGLSWEVDVEPTVMHLINKYPDVELTVCDWA